MRIVCLSAETADLCARVGAWEDVVAVSAYADQNGLPAKPIASGFSSGGAERILTFEPDLVLGYSDVQADLAAELLGSLPDDGLHPEWSAELTRRALRARQNPGGGEPWETVEERLRSRLPNG